MELRDLINQKISNLRPKLLDLSRRNPLISTRLTPRSNSTLRAVDELPDVLFYKLSNGQMMRFASLPAIEDEPRDELTDAFRDALNNARIVDEAYLAALDAVDQDDEDALDQTRLIERELKDRIRELLGLAPRIDKSDINLAQHARNKGVTPSYDLPSPDRTDDDERFQDNDIQTLLLPKDFERKLRNIRLRGQTWIQETGINVLHAAYGFLEWSEATEASVSFAPLVLQAIEIAERKSHSGVEFYVSDTGEEPELNAVLAEKLRLDFKVELPEFAGSSIEEYLQTLSKKLPKNLGWRIRRQVSFGIFPSARMAMYHDIDPAAPDFPVSEVVDALFGGTSTDASLPFAEDYNVDEPEVERAVPVLVKDADSSQFSTIVDIQKGKNLAVEGPPGSGKSQTIVNAIAAALWSGKKVLFVAEKLAALDVVRSRLEQVGLGEFLLPLQAERSSREQVINSLRERMEMTPPRAVPELEVQLQEFRESRDSMREYLDITAETFGDSEYTVHEILWRGISTGEHLAELSSVDNSKVQVPDEYLSKIGNARLRKLAEIIEQAAERALGASELWQGARLQTPDPFTLEQITGLAKNAGLSFLTLAQAREELASIGLLNNEGIDELRSTLAHLVASKALDPAINSSVILAALKVNAANVIGEFLDRCEANAALKSKLVQVFATDLDEGTHLAVQRADAICKESGFRTIDPGRLQQELQHKKQATHDARELYRRFEALLEAAPEARHWPLAAVAKAHELQRELGEEHLALRNVTNMNPATYSLFEAALARGLQLQKVVSGLSDEVSIDSGLDPEIVRRHALNLRSAGLFAAFSSQFRAARKFARGTIKRQKLNVSQMAELLEQLSNYLRDCKAFEGDRQCALIFGVYFNGVGTDFAAFQHLLKFAGGVRSEFRQPRLREVRDFLLFSEADDVQLLPLIEDAEFAETFERLEVKLESAAGDLEIATQMASELGEVAKVFVDPSLVQRDALDGIARVLKGYLDQRTALNEDTQANDILDLALEGAETNVAMLRPLVDWARISANTKDHLSAVISASDANSGGQVISRVISAHDLANQLFDELCAMLGLNSDSWREKMGHRELGDLLLEAAGDRHGLANHSALSSALGEFEDASVSQLVNELLLAGKRESIAATLDAIAARQLARKAYRKHGKTLSRFDGVRLNDIRSAIRRADAAVIRLSRQKLRAKLRANARPPYGNGTGRKSTWTDLALIQNEIAKKRRFVSVRDLTNRAGKALQELKPCWMMSPLATAQYIPKGGIKFDLCIIDEASQMPPEDAIGAMLRSNQVIVVGDTNQLPPSSFFRKAIDDEDADEDDTVLEESVLEMANATFRPPRRLRWHYRSRDSRLIKFSNHHVYKNDLIIFPSAFEQSGQTGVEFNYLPGIYKSGTNPIEARELVEAILRFMRDEPDMSLGVVTLNQKQRDLILEEFEHRSSSNMPAQRYLDKWATENDGLEKFFVKNLENVQGDERDAIFIGTVYGPETPGARVMQRFGPINGIAGKRRLNVLFTRAKKKIVTFSSMTGADILADENGNAGVHMLRRWLEYSATGILEGGETSDPSEPDSDFEVFVANQIRSMGCEPVPQVGVSGYFIDIGIKHPDWPHGYVMGVECDGATYHSSKSARDRDRLRQEVLEGLGWHLHRIWSTDWFSDPASQAERLREALRRRLAELLASDNSNLGPLRSKDIEADESSPEQEFVAKDETEEEVKTADDVAERMLPAEIGVKIGDTVQVRYLDGEKRVLRITISDRKTNLEQGVVYYEAPIAMALLGAEEGEEVEVLTGTYVRPAIVEQIVAAG